MDYMAVMAKYWEDPAVEVIPARQTEAIIAWLGRQTPETWHSVVRTWNYDYGDKVLTWILSQDRCDRGTAARVFLVEGTGHWLWEVIKSPHAYDDASHLCRVVLDNWHRYQTATFTHDYQITEAGIEGFLEKDELQRLIGPRLAEILRHKGDQKALSDYVSTDGAIMVAFGHWLKSSGLDGTPGAADALRVMGG